MAEDIQYYQTGGIGSSEKPQMIQLFRYRGHLQSIGLARSGIPRHRWRRLSPHAGYRVAPPLLAACGKASPWYNQVVMAIVIRVYSDGKVLVPEEPTELPVGHLEAELRPWGPQLSDEEIKRRLEALDRFEELSVRGLSIPNEALDRESLYDPPRGL